jgi:AraC-like DNA-binding protein
MKILQFTLPVPDNKTIITKEERLPYLYPHLHRHYEVQLIWVIEGEGTLVADNSMHDFQSNEIYWIGANQPHVFKSDPSYFDENSGKKTETLNIFFNLDTHLASFFSIPEVKYLSQFIKQHNRGFKVPQEKVAIISGKILMVNQTSAIEQFMHFIELLKILATFDNLKPLSGQAKNITCNEQEGVRIARVYNYIMQNYEKHITLEEAAKLAFMTPQAFCRYFKKHTQHTLISFINEVRINEACRKLSENKFESIASIAYNTGFNSITNFNRVFKSVMKKSPKEFLGSYLQKVQN